MIFSKYGSLLTIPRADEPAYWAVKRTDGSFVCECDVVSNIMHGRRNLDWTLDIVSTGDWKHISELWLFCPPTPASPSGNTARLPITTAGTAFQLKVAHMDSVVTESRHTLAAQLIGRVMDSEGACECFIFDYGLEGMIASWQSNIYRFGSWQPKIAPLGALSLQVLGINLPSLACQN